MIRLLHIITFLDVREAVACRGRSVSRMPYTDACCHLNAGARSL